MQSSMRSGAGLQAALRVHRRGELESKGASCSFSCEAKKSGKVKEFMQKFKVDKDLAIP